VKEEKEGGEEPPAGELYAAKTGAACGSSRTRRERLLPLLPLPPRRRAAAHVFFLTGKPRRLTSPPRSTSASGHRGEDTRFSPLVDATAIEPRQNAHRSAPPLVMPAIEPGWDAFSCRCRRLHQRARAICLA
jgi:hypothetical protein